MALWPQGLEACSSRFLMGEEAGEASPGSGKSEIQLQSS